MYCRTLDCIVAVGKGVPLLAGLGSEPVEVTAEANPQLIAWSRIALLERELLIDGGWRGSHSDFSWLTQLQSAPLKSKSRPSCLSGWVSAYPTAVTTLFFSLNESAVSLTAQAPHRASPSLGRRSSLCRRMQLKQMGTPRAPHGAPRIPPLLTYTHMCMSGTLGHEIRDTGVQTRGVLKLQRSLSRAQGPVAMSWGTPPHSSPASPSPHTTSGISNTRKQTHTLCRVVSGRDRVTS